MENDFRRFRVLTDDAEKAERLFRLISEKSLSREDLYLLLTGLGLNFDIFPGSNMADIDTLTKGLYEALKKGEKRCFMAELNNDLEELKGQCRSRITFLQDTKKSLTERLCPSQTESTKPALKDLEEAFDRCIFSEYVDLLNLQYEDLCSRSSEVSNSENLDSHCISDSNAETGSIDSLQAALSKRLKWLVDAFNKIR